MKTRFLLIVFTILLSMNYNEAHPLPRTYIQLNVESKTQADLGTKEDAYHPEVPIQSVPIEGIYLLHITKYLVLTREGGIFRILDEKCTFCSFRWNSNSQSIAFEVGYKLNRTTGCSSDTSHILYLRLLYE